MNLSVIFSKICNLTPPPPLTISHKRVEEKKKLSVKSQSAVFCFT